MKPLIPVLLAAGVMAGEGLSYHSGTPAWVFSGTTVWFSEPVVTEGEFVISVGNETGELRRYSWAALKTTF